MKKLLLLTLVLLFGFLTIKVSLANAQELVNSVKIDILDSKTSNLEINFNLKDQSNVNYLTGFELTFPLEIPGNITGSINNNPVSVEKIDEDTKTIIKISTENLAIDLASDTWLKLNFQVPDLLKNKYEINYLYLPDIESNFNLGDIKFEVTYPQDFDKPSFISANNPEFQHENMFSINLDRSLFVIWGQNLKSNLKFDLSISNKDSVDKAFLINLPSNINQDVQYVDFPEMDGGVYDQYLNNFAVKNINADASSSLSLNANVTVQKSEEDIKNSFSKFNWNLKSDSQFAKNLIESTKDTNDFKSKIEGINNFLVNNLTPYVTEKFELTSLSGIWDKLNGASQFNSFEYCYLAISAAEYFNYKGNIVYGYLLIPDFLLSEKRSPHVWCEISNNDETYFIDPFLEDQFMLSYNFDQPLDRILFGRWSPEMEHNNILGLISQDSQEIQLEINDFQNVDVENIIDITFEPQPGDLYSGDYFYADVSINNKSKYFLELKSISVDDSQLINTIGVKDFYPALLPNKETVIPLDNLREPNILFNGTKDLKIKIEVDNPNFSEESLVKAHSVFFKINVATVIKELIIISVVIGLLVIVYKLVIEKHLRKFFGKSIES